MRSAPFLRLTFLLLATTLAVPAAAQAPTGSDGTSADDLAHRGNDLALRHQWAEAEALFRRAWSLKQSYDIGGNLGIASLALGKHRDAAEHLSFAVKHFPANGKPEHLELLREKLAKAQAEIGTRTVEVSLPGAEVRVDGQRAGVSPLPDAVFLDPGTHRIAATLPGYETATVVAEVARGSSGKVEIVLRAPQDKRFKPPLALTLGAGALALGGLATGIGLTVAANGKRHDADTLRSQLVGAGGTCAGASGAVLAKCQGLQSAANSRDALSEGAVAGYVVGGAFAIAAAALGWRTAVATSDEQEKRTGLRVVPAAGVGSAGLLVAGTW